jgi:hypothetical protein
MSPSKITPKLLMYVLTVYKHGLSQVLFSVTTGIPQFKKAIHSMRTIHK